MGTTADKCGSVQKSNIYVDYIVSVILAVSGAPESQWTIRPFEEMMPTVLYVCVQVDLTTAEERLQEEVGALRCLQSSFFWSCGQPLWKTWKVCAALNDEIHI